MQTEVKEKPQYAIAASVQLPGVSDVEFEVSLTELRELAKTLGFTCEEESWWRFVRLGNGQ